MGRNQIEYPKLTAFKGTDLAYIITPSGVTEDNGFNKYINYLMNEYNKKLASQQVAPKNEEDGQTKLFEDVVETPSENQSYEGNQINLFGEEESSTTQTETQPHLTATERVLAQKRREEHANKRQLRSYCVKIYKRQGKSLEELEQDIYNNTAILLGDTFFSAVNQTFTPDDNGNLLLRTFGSSLDDIMRPCGDMLISSDGTILKESKGSYAIFPCDSFGNYEVAKFVARRNSKEDEVDIVRIDHNFIDKNGKFFSNKAFTHTTEPTFYTLDHTFSAQSQKLYIDNKKEINPRCYVYLDKNECKLFPSATALLIENRARKQIDGAEGYIADETPYIIEHYERLEKIPQVLKRLAKLYSDGKISYTTYRTKTAEIDGERVLSGIFTNEFEEPDDRRKYNEYLCDKDDPFADEYYDD